MADQSVAWDELDTQGPPSASDAAAHAMLEHRKLAQKVPVPTSDTQVRERLRHYHEPITLFGEREPDRRARLLHVLVDRHGKNAVHVSHAPQAPEEDEEEDEDSDEDDVEPGPSHASIRDQIWQLFGRNRQAYVRITNT